MYRRVAHTHVSSHLRRCRLLRSFVLRPSAFILRPFIPLSLLPPSSFLLPLSPSSPLLPSQDFVDIASQPASESASTTASTTRPPPHTAFCPCTHVQAMRSAHPLDGAVPSPPPLPPSCIFLTHVGQVGGLSNRSSVMSRQERLEQRAQVNHTCLHPMSTPMSTHMSIHMVRPQQPLQARRIHMHGCLPHPCGHNQFCEST